MLNQALSDTHDTIFALSTTQGRAGIAVMRLSGPKAKHVAETLTGIILTRPRHAYYRTLRDVAGQSLDQSLVLLFPAPNSFTGETVVELHLHGSLAVIEAVSDTLLALGLRHATPGEFTRRAVQNGKMDLTEAEGLADLIDAQSRAQRTQALRQMEGQLSLLYRTWQSGLLDALAQVEGEIDFPDEADIPDALSHAAYAPLSHVITSMKGALERAHRGQSIRDGIHIAIIGAPNAGKSTLINTLLGRDVAITSDQPGTTRDVVQAQMNLAGLLVTLSDTAGLRDTRDQIEQEGVRRALATAESADLRLLLERDGVPTDRGIRDALRDGDLVLSNVAGAPDNNDQINALTGDGIPLLLERLHTRLSQRFSQGEPPSLTRSRHVDCVRRAHQAAHMARDRLGDQAELVSEDIRIALTALEELAGRADIESVFDRIFSEFCIGK